MGYPVLISAPSHYPSELGKTPWSEKITHVAIVNGRGYEYLDYEVEQKAPHAVLPMHLKP